MSYRASFVTEFIPCSECRRQLFAQLSAKLGPSLVANVPSDATGDAPIIAGYLNSSHSFEPEELMHALSEFEPCHGINFAIVHDGGRSVSHWHLDAGSEWLQQVSPRKNEPDL